MSTFSLSSQNLPELRKAWITTFAPEPFPDLRKDMILREIRSRGFTKIVMEWVPFSKTSKVSRLRFVK